MKLNNYSRPEYIKAAIRTGKSVFFLDKTPEHGLRIVSVTLGMSIHHAWSPGGKSLNMK